MNRRFLYIILIYSVLMMAMTSCDNKNLSYISKDSVTIRIQYDWRDAPEANPRGMVVYFYPEENNFQTAHRFSFSGTEGSEISIPSGRYHLISYNNDTELASGYDTNDFFAHNLYTRPAYIFDPSMAMGEVENNMPRPEGTEKEPVTVAPEEIWGCTALDVEVNATSVSYRAFPYDEKDNWENLKPIKSEHVITLYPHDLICHYSYEVRNVSNLHTVVRQYAALTGMSPRLTVHDESHADYTVTIPVPAEKADENTIKGEFITFGHHDELEAPHKFALYLTRTDGNTLFYGQNEDAFDVTEQIHNAPDKRRVHFIIDGLNLPGVETGAGGWQPGADDWTVDNETIIIK